MPETALATEKMKTAGRSLSRPASKASFPPSTTLQRLLHLEHARAAKAEGMKRVEAVLTLPVNIAARTRKNNKNSNVNIFEATDDWLYKYPAVYCASKT